MSRINADGTITIPLMPLRSGLITSGQQTTISEDALWQAQNVIAGIDGLMEKRPGLYQWGQTIKLPDTSDTGSSTTAFVPFINGIVDFALTDGSSGLIDTSTSNGVLTTNVREGTGAEDYLLGYTVGALSANTTWSLRFMFRGTNLPAYTALDTVPDTFMFRAQGAATSTKEFGIWSGGIYYQQDSDDTYHLVENSDLAGDGGWHVIEVRSDQTGNTSVYLDDVLCEAFLSTLAKNVAITGNHAFEFYWQVEGQTGSGTQYSTKLSTPMYNDTIAAPFVGQPVSAITDFQFVNNSSTRRRCLLIAAGGHIYHDLNLESIWRPLIAKQHDNVYFIRYRNTAIWSDNNGSGQSNLWQWDGMNVPENLEDEDAAPPIRFMTAHQQRLWAAGDRSNPLRLYYAGDRQPDVWFSPAPDNVEDQYDTLLNAGYLEIPSESGDEITAIFGDFYGVLVVFTHKGVWKVSGSGFASYAINAISLRSGCVSPHGVTQVGNDLWFISRYGVHSLTATEQFGDIQMQYPSIAIGDLWGLNPSTVNPISQTYIHKSRLDYNPQLGLVYVAVPLSDDIEANNIYIFNKNNNQWYGPWPMENRAMRSIELAYPIIEVMAHGDSSGRVGCTYQGDKADFTNTAIELIIESAYINGRTIDPRLASLQKSWKRIRLYMLPRGDWDYTLTYWTDSDPVEGTRTESQIPNIKKRSFYILGEEEDDGTGDFRLDVTYDGMLHSREEMIVREFQLDKRGQALAFKIVQTGVGEDFVLQGVELDVLPDGYEAED